MATVGKLRLLRSYSADIGNYCNVHTRNNIFEQINVKLNQVFIYYIFNSEITLPAKGDWKNNRISTIYNAKIYKGNIK